MKQVSFVVVMMNVLLNGFMILFFELGSDLEIYEGLGYTIKNWFNYDE